MAVDVQILAGLFPFWQLHSLSLNHQCFCWGLSSPLNTSLSQFFIILSVIFAMASGSLPPSFLLGGLDMQLNWTTVSNLMLPGFFLISYNTYPLPSTHSALFQMTLLYVIWNVNSFANMLLLNCPEITPCAGVILFFFAKSEFCFAWNIFSFCKFNLQIFKVNGNHLMFLHYLFILKRYLIISWL